MYYYFLDKIKKEPEYRKELETLVIKKWQEGNVNKQTGIPKKFDYSSLHGLYHLRGENRKKAKTLGKPLTYDRLCLAACSCLCLAHYRLSISILYIVLYE